MKLTLHQMCDCSNYDQLKVAIAKAGYKIVSEYNQTFIDGSTEIQPLVEIEDGRRFWFSPTSKASRERQSMAGRYLPLYGLVKA